MLTRTDHAKEQAKVQIEHICEMMEALKVAQEKGKATYEGDELDEDTMRERIEENALSIQVRSGWQAPGEALTPVEFEILLCTGGPAVRIIGDMGSDIRVEYQDWGTLWTEYWNITQEQNDAILDYCHMHYLN